MEEGFKLDRLTILNAVPREKSYKLFDGYGLYIEILPSGTKSWRLKYTIFGKENRLSPGLYNESKKSTHVSLKLARQKAEAARVLIREGTDPSVQKKEAKRPKNTETDISYTFKNVALELVDVKKKRTSETNWSNFLRSMELHVFDTFGDRHINSITSLEIIAIGQKTESAGKYTARRIVQRIGEVINHGILTERRERANPIMKATYHSLSVHKTESYPRIPFTDLPEFLRDIDTSRSFPLTKYLMKFLLLTATRTREARELKFSWIDFDKGIITFSEADHKVSLKLVNSGKPGFKYVIPITPLLKKLLLKTLNETGAADDDYVFPTAVNYKKQASENAVTYAIKEMHKGKWWGKMVGHGFRGLATTELKARGYDKDLVNIQTGHIVGTKTERAYDDFEMLALRREMMEFWENECIKAGLII